MPIRYLRRKDVTAMTGLPRTTLYRKMADGDFPRPIKLGERAVAWSEEEVTDWLESRPRAV